MQEASSEILEVLSLRVPRTEPDSATTRRRKKISAVPLADVRRS